MKLSKNILIVLASYLGMLVLVSCTAQFLKPIGTAGETGTNASVNAGAEQTGGDDVPAGARPEESVAATEAEDTLANEDLQGSAGADMPTYVLRSVRSEGNDSLAVIGVYDENGTLLYALDTPVYALPVGDRALLEVGIEVSGDDALEDLIEDFGG